jgi:hypothetical protein
MVTTARHAPGTLLVAGLVLLVCGTGTAVILIYVLTGNHGASFADLGIPLALLAWGAVGALAVLGRRAWARPCILAWAGAGSLVLAAAWYSGGLNGSTSMALMAATLLVAITLGERTRVQR